MNISNLKGQFIKIFKLTGPQILHCIENEFENNETEFLAQNLANYPEKFMKAGILLICIFIFTNLWTMPIVHKSAGATPNGICLIIYKVEVKGKSYRSKHRVKKLLKNEEK